MKRTEPKYILTPSGRFLASNLKAGWEEEQEREGRAMAREYEAIRANPYLKDMLPR